MTEHDPTAIDPNEVIEGPPPPEFEPQPGLATNQSGGITEREPDLIAEAEHAEPDLHSVEDGEADEGDDATDEEDDD